MRTPATKFVIVSSKCISAFLDELDSHQSTSSFKRKSITNISRLSTINGACKSEQEKMYSVLLETQDKV